MIRSLTLLLLPFAAQAEAIRVASFNTELSREGPGLLLKDIQRQDPQVAAIVAVLVETRPDVVALQSIDWDLDGLAVQALIDALGSDGLSYPHWFSAQPNSGMATDLDMDGDGRMQQPGDAQGWGRFTGNGGLAVLSRHPIQTEDIRDFSDLLWKDLPGATLPTQDGMPFPSAQAQEIQRLSSSAHWIVPIDTPLGRINLLTYHATPPVFDGPEDRNGLRNRDETRLWSLLLDGEFGEPPTVPFVIAGDANLDPNAGDGHRQAMRDLLEHPKLQDPLPTTPEGDIATVEWKAVGEMRVDYVLPSTDWTVLDAGVHWPAPDTAPGDAARAASRHRLVWVDLTK
ncbi:MULTISPECIES: endonuclease/exonuclease/phosphatase family protein [unclassified Ruegeria]|uniref:endonuclease/exonuclease/phosphatase family protein n=1 Tax=unclassified Ruegeria TaxID=2625375 RepID=UPI0014895CBD|nr:MULTISPECIES: endonuclease/exonuclease/phosphatase family protein [unclassified Ruegeria]